LASLFAGGSDDRTPRRRWTDRVLGIGLGLLIGLGVLVYFIFVHSEGTIDAPKVNEGGGGAARTTGTPTTPAQPAGGEGAAEGGAKQGAAGGGGAPKPKPVPVVKVIGGAPPTESGPKQLTFRKGEKVRFEVETDEPFSFEIRGLNIKQSIENSSIIAFKATKVGQFPVIASATLIGVADLQIKPHR
jgi:hypothetical protein